MTQASRLRFISLPGLALLCGCAGQPWLRAPERPPPRQLAPGELDCSLLLLGDAGLGLPQPLFELTLREASLAPERTLFLWLGDNIYPRGLPSESEPGTRHERRRALEVLRQQLELGAAAGARSVFLPGNHDWHYGGRFGLERIVAQGDAIAASGHQARMLPEPGCPGPVWLDLGERLRLVLFDSEWLLRRGLPRRETDCPWGPVGAERLDERVDEDLLFEHIDAALSGAGGRSVVLAAHHPIASHGPNAGCFGWRDWLFPATNLKPWAWLPVPGLYPPVRWLVHSNQDMHGPLNRELQRRLRKLLERHAVLAYVSGHEHGLQVLEGPGGTTLVVSGAASRRDHIGHGDDTRLAWSRLGLMRLDLPADGSAALLSVLVPDEGGQPWRIRLRLPDLRPAPRGGQPGAPAVSWPHE